jgi:hypothetical protein
VDRLVPVRVFLVERQQMPRQLTDELAILLRQAQPLGDHQHREGSGKVLQHLHAASVFDLGQQITDHLLHQRAESPGDVLGIEMRVDHPPHPEMVRRIAPDEPMT